MMKVMSMRESMMSTTTRGPPSLMYLGMISKMPLATASDTTSTIVMNKPCLMVTLLFG